MVCNDEQLSNHGSNDCENVDDHMLGRNDESRKEPKDENEFLGLLVNNESGETQNYGEIQDTDAGRTDFDNCNVNDTCNASGKQACTDVSSDKEDNGRHTVNIIGGEQF